MPKPKKLITPDRKLATVGRKCRVGEAGDPCCCEPSGPICAHCVGEGGTPSIVRVTFADIDIDVGTHAYAFGNMESYTVAGTFGGTFDLPFLGFTDGDAIVLADGEARIQEWRKLEGFGCVWGAVFTSGMSYTMNSTNPHPFFLIPACDITAATCTADRVAIMLEADGTGTCRLRAVLLYSFAYSFTDGGAAAGVENNIEPAGLFHSESVTPLLPPCGDAEVMAVPNDLVATDHGTLGKDGEADVVLIP